MKFFEKFFEVERDTAKKERKLDRLKMSNVFKCDIFSRKLSLLEISLQTIRCFCLADTKWKCSEQNYNQTEPMIMLYDLN